MPGYCNRKSRRGDVVVLKRSRAALPASWIGNTHGATHRKVGPANVKERRRCETPFTCCHRDGTFCSTVRAFVTLCDIRTKKDYRPVGLETIFRLVAFVS